MVLLVFAITLSLPHDLIELWDNRLFRINVREVTIQPWEGLTFEFGNCSNIIRQHSMIIGQLLILDNNN